MVMSILSILSEACQSWSVDEWLIDQPFITYRDLLCILEVELVFGPKLSFADLWQSEAWNGKIPVEVNKLYRLL